MCKSKWDGKQAEQRNKLRQLARQISVAEANSKGRFKQKAKDWIATNKPDSEKGYQSALCIIREHNEIQQQRTTQQLEQSIRVVSRDNKEMER